MNHCTNSAKSVAHAIHSARTPKVQQFAFAFKSANIRFHAFMAENIESWFWIIAWLITILGVSGNASVIYLIATNHLLRKNTNWFVLSLSTADLLVSLIYIPLFHTCWKMESCSNKGWLVGYQADNAVVISLLVGH